MEVDSDTKVVDVMDGVQSAADPETLPAAEEAAPPEPLREDSVADIKTIVPHTSIESPPTIQKATDTPNYKTKYILSGHARSISAIKFSPDGTMLASCGEYFILSISVLSYENVWKQGADKLVKLWDVENGDIIRTLQGHTEGVSDIAWSVDSDYLASASDDKTIWIWSMETVRQHVRTIHM